MKPTCANCGIQADQDDLPLGWSAGVEHGRRIQTCEICTRTHARSIEAKLDSEWW